MLLPHGRNELILVLQSLGLILFRDTGELQFFLQLKCYFSAKYKVIHSYLLHTFYII